MTSIRQFIRKKEHRNYKMYKLSSTQTSLTDLKKNQIESCYKHGNQYFQVANYTWTNFILRMPFFKLVRRRVKRRIDEHRTTAWAETSGNVYRAHNKICEHRSVYYLFHEFIIVINTVCNI